MSRIPLYIRCDVSEFAPSFRRTALLIAECSDAGRPVAPVPVVTPAVAGWYDRFRLPPPSPFRRRHDSGCPCCAREGLTLLLAGIFQDRILERRHFEAVVIQVGPGEYDDMKALLANDGLLSARYAVSV